MALTDVAIRKAKPAAKPYKVADSQGLYLVVNPHGSKLWRVCSLALSFRPRPTRSPFNACSHGGWSCWVM